MIERVSKKFASKGRVVLPDEDGIEEAVCTSVGREDCGQPSPVSVLECPFEDETTSSQGNIQESICGALAIYRNGGLLLRLEIAMPS